MVAGGAGVRGNACRPRAAVLFLGLGGLVAAFDQAVAADQGLCEKVAWAAGGQAAAEQFVWLQVLPGAGTLSWQKFVAG